MHIPSLKELINQSIFLAKCRQEVLHIKFVSNKFVSFIGKIQSSLENEITEIAQRMLERN